MIRYLYIVIFCEMITMVSLVSIHHHSYKFFSCDRSWDLIKLLICTVSSKTTYMKVEFINLLQMHDGKEYDEC